MPLEIHQDVGELEGSPSGRFDLLRPLVLREPLTPSCRGGHGAVGDSERISHVRIVHEVDPHLDSCGDLLRSLDQLLRDLLAPIG